QPTQQLRRVAAMNPDVVQAVIGNRGERFRHAVDERLHADESGVRMVFCLIDQVLAAAEPYFENDLRDGILIKCRKIGGFAGEIDGKARQQRFKQRRMPGFELVAFAPAEKCARRSLMVVGDQRTARLRTSVRSVLSQEKPPSFSWARPKC